MAAGAFARLEAMRVSARCGLAFSWATGASFSGWGAASTFAFSPSGATPQPASASNRPTWAAGRRKRTGSDMMVASTGDDPFTR
ncbi:hypothetical protein D9M70_575240 [compost metagenome]